MYDTKFELPFAVRTSRSMQHSPHGHHVILSTAACRKEIVAIAIHTTMSPQEHFDYTPVIHTKRQEEDHQQISQMAREKRARVACNAS